HLESATSRRMAIHALSCSLFAHGLHMSLQMRERQEEAVSFENLLAELRIYNHFDSRDGQMDQIDPDGFGTHWPMKWVAQLIQLYPSIQLTLNAVRRIADPQQRPQEATATSIMSEFVSPPVVSRSLPISVRIYFFAGAIAGGVVPGIEGQPFPEVFGGPKMQHQEPEDDVTF
ncbi:MAG: hypothetical protein OSB09_08595, partial [Planctomycetota bacterium]|nr:hypothetical protein [Planctomycetota bacterium]